MQTGCSHPSSSPVCQPSLPFRSGFRVEETFPGSWLNPLIWKENLVGRRLSGASAGRCPVASASQSAAAAPSPVLGNIPPNDGMPGGPIPPGFFQPPGGVPGTQPLLPNSMDPTRQQGHPNMGGSMQRMNPPRGMGPMGPGPQNYGSGMRPPPNSLGPAMPGINMGPGAGRPWPNPNSANSIPYSSSSPGTYVGPPGGGGPPGTPIMPSPADSTNSSDNIYTMINPVPPGGSRSNFPMGPGSDGPMGGMGGMEPHHMNGSLGSGDIDGLPKNSPNNISGISNPPGTPRDDGELGGNFLHSFQNDNYSPSMTMSV
ncbi:single-stranded DNA-binding protein 3 isoform X5 [Mustela erminea]|uniref:single-stranded DNA-binding protein 3 isoform X5 n=1 Tax=Mustela erminea TaxID=36723 RepID=UPI001386FB55|nr:single-stranded DNA-binding protein 3 isoform X5 [Mustela erminea]